MKKKDNIFALSVLFILFFQWWSRYSGAPVVDFTIDDWKLWKIASSCNSLKEAFMQALNWPDRPIGTGIMISTFYLLDDFILGYVVLESLYTALFLLGGMCIVHALTQDRLVVIIFGLVFSLLPNLTETFQFHTMTISYGLGFAAYMWSCYLWVLYLRNKRFSMLLYAGLSYGFALGSYEAGLFLPAAWLLLGTGRNRRQIISGIFVFGSAALFYLFWKFTDGVGLVETRLFPSRGFNPDWAGYIWNAKEIVRWWTGSRMLECIANGLNGFLTLSPFAMRLLAFINIIIIITTVVVVNATRKVSGNAFSPYSKKRLVVFCLSWVAVTNMLAVLSWPCGRLNYLPAAGVAFLLALVCRQLMDKRISIGILLVMMLCLMVNQGTSVQWLESGIFHRAMYKHLQETKEEWRAAPIVLFDTSGFRNRMTRRLLAETGPIWGNYGNALLIRGAFMKTMMDLAVSHRENQTVLLDMEHGAYVDGAMLHWHGWYDPSVHYSSAMTNVYWIDCLEVGLKHTSNIP